MIDSVIHIPPIGKSDYDVLIYDLNIDIPHDNETTYFNYFKGNYCQMRNDLKEVNWGNVNDYNIEKGWYFLKRTILNSCVPMRTKITVKVQFG